MINDELAEFFRGGDAEKVELIVRDLLRDGMDTMRLAIFFGVTEAEVYNHLPGTVSSLRRSGQHLEHLPAIHALAAPNQGAAR